MTAKIVVEDVMLDSEPIGLADGFVPVGSPLTTVVGTDEQAEVEAVVYFGVELLSGDIGEVKGKVVACVAVAELYAVTVEVLELDSRCPDLLARTLRGEVVAPDSDQGGPHWGIGLKQTNGALAALVNCPAGLLTGEQLTSIAEITKKGHGLAKLTHAQRIILLLRPEQIETVRSDLEKVGLRIGVLHTGVRNIRGCCGALCSFSQGGDALGLALELDKALYGRPMKFDVKIAVSDCLRNCMESFCVDIGLIARGNRYDLYVGGAASSVHLRGIRLTSGILPAETIAFVTRVLDWYDGQALEGERFYKTLERIGAAERPLPATPHFAESAALFAELGMADTIAAYLNRSFTRGVAVARMRTDLGLTA